MEVCFGIFEVMMGWEFEKKNWSQDFWSLIYFDSFFRDFLALFGIFGIWGQLYGVFFYFIYPSSEPIRTLDDFFSPYFFL